jgi:hypothetical protein
VDQHRATSSTLGLTYVFLIAHRNCKCMSRAPRIISCVRIADIFILQFAIYGATIDYMVESYGPYSASATGGNGFARDFLAGVSAMYATPRK